jgi:hypothetical protein
LVQSKSRNLTRGMYAFLKLHCTGTQLIYLSFRQIAPFGTAIRRFTHNVADMNKLAARDFEDILQVCPVCFWRVLATTLIYILILVLHTLH